MSSSNHHCGLGRLKSVPVRVPVRCAVAHDDLAAARTAHRVAGPAAARGHPHHVRAVVGRRRHQHVVTVGDDHRRRVTRQTGPQRALDVVDLTDPVELIAGQVQQHDRRAGSTASATCGTCISSTSSAASAASAGRGQRGHQPGVHVGALGVGGDRPERAQRRRGHPGGGRLAVGAGDDDRAPARAELAQDRAVQRHRDQAADHRARAAAGDPRRPARARSGRQCDASTGGDHPGSASLPPSGDHPGISGGRHAGSPIKHCQRDRAILTV